VRSLVLITTWFGPWPAWINFYLESCRRNEDVNWLIFTDQEPPENRPPNVDFVHTSTRALLDRIGGVIGLDLSGIDQAYKLCDLRPAFGHAFEAEIAPYTNYGFADLDVVFGRIRHIYTDEMLATYDTISTARYRITGHLAVFRNTRRVRLSYRYIHAWRRRAADPKHHALDERHYRRVFASRNPLLGAIKGLFWKSLFVERYSTWGDHKTPWWSGEPWPLNWIWKDGRLTNTQDDAEYLYIHFMRWHSSRHRPAGDPAPWPQLGDRVIQLPWRRGAEEGFSISPDGIQPLVRAEQVETT